jgi:hypothetical protein
LVAIKRKQKRNKATKILLFPALFFIFILGYGMYWIGSKKKPNVKHEKTPKKDNVTFMPIILEEKQQTAYS